MIKVKDNSGNVQNGLYAEHKGIFVFSDKTEYNQYIKRREVLLDRKNEVDFMKNKIDRLEKIIESLSEKING